MTAGTKTTLKGYFNTGDTPSESNFADLIDTIGFLTLTVAASDASDASKGRADYVCNGTADDVEIQAAIDALPANGGIVRLSEGTFTIAAPIIADNGSNVVIEGVGFSTVITQSADLGSGRGAIEIGNNSTLCNRCSIRDLALVLDSEESYTEGHGIRVRGNANDCLIMNVMVQDAPENGFDLGESSGEKTYDNLFLHCRAVYCRDNGFRSYALASDCRWDKCIVEGGKLVSGDVDAYTVNHGFWLKGGSHILNSCHAYFVGGKGFVVDGGDSTYTDCISESNIGRGFELSGNADRTILKGCKIYGNGHNQTNGSSTEVGMYLSQADDVTIDDCWFHKGVGDAANPSRNLYIADCDQVKITNCHFYDADEGHILLLNSERAIMRGNHLNGARSYSPTTGAAPDYGLQVSDTSIECLISENIIRDAGVKAIKESGTTPDNNTFLYNAVDIAGVTIVAGSTEVGTITIT